MSSSGLGTGSAAGRAGRVALGLVVVLAAALAAPVAARVEPAPEAASPPPVEQEVSEAFHGHAFTLLGHETPRLLYLEDLVTAPIELRNDGSLTWRGDAGFNVGYHWRSLTGDMVQKNGIRTPLPRDVEPEGSVGLEARLRPPPKPGIYRLEWDVVHEKVTWFSSRDPTPVETIVVVVSPPRVTVFASWVPLAAALLGLALVEWARRRPRREGLRRAAGLADLAWVGVALAMKPLLLYEEASLETAPQALPITLSFIAAILLGLFFVAPRVRPWLAWGVAAFASLFLWGDILYYRFFEDLVSAPSFLAAHQTGDLLESARYLAERGDWRLAPDLVAGLLLALRVGVLAGAARRSRALARGVAVALAAAVVPGLWLSVIDPVFRDLPRRRTPPPMKSVVSQGLWAHQARDLVAHLRRRWIRTPLTGRDVEAIVAWFEERAPTRAGAPPWLGAAEGKNLLAIQVESMQQFVLGLELAGQRITPNLDRMLERALVFPNTRDQTSSGRSSDGDFVNFTSLLPVTDSVAYQYTSNRFTTLTEALEARGYSAVAAIPFSPTFWNRQLTYPAYGFETAWFRRDFEDGLKIGWGLNDLDFLRQVSGRLETLPRPFFAWLTTLSLHFPYAEFPDEMKSLDFGAMEGTGLANYLHAMHLFDRAFGELVAELERSGLADETVIAIWGDHDSGLHQIHEFTGFIGTEYTPLGRFLADRVPLAIWVPGAEAPRGRREIVAGHLDIAPTLMALLGIDPAGYAFLGRNLLGEPDAFPVVHPRGSWTDGEWVYLDGEEGSSGQGCFSAKTLEGVPAARCEPGNAAARRLLEVAEQVLVHDLQATVTERLQRDAAAGEP